MTGAIGRGADRAGRHRPDRQPWRPDLAGPAAAAAPSRPGRQDRGDRAAARTGPRPRHPDGGARRLSLAPVGPSRVDSSGAGASDLCVPSRPVAGSNHVADFHRRWNPCPMCWRFALPGPANHRIAGVSKHERAYPGACTSPTGTARIGHGHGPGPIAGGRTGPRSDARAPGRRAPAASRVDVATRAPDTRRSSFNHATPMAGEGCTPGPRPIRRQPASTVPVRVGRAYQSPNVTGRRKAAR